MENTTMFELYSEY